jgi:hypothetical protein
VVGVETEEQSNGVAARGGERVCGGVKARHEPTRALVIGWTTDKSL